MGIQKNFQTWTLYIISMNRKLMDIPTVHSILEYCEGVYVLFLYMVTLLCYFYVGLFQPPHFLSDFRPIPALYFNIPALNSEIFPFLPLYVVAQAFFL